MTLRYKFYTRDDHVIRRIHVNLATEIGLNESIVLMQIDHLINVEGNDKYYDCRYWTYDSLEDVKKKHFPFWSESTLKRAITNLVDLDLLIKGNYNKLKFDKTIWYTVNYEKATELKSVLVGYTDAKGMTHALGQNDLTRRSKRPNEKVKMNHTIPKTSTKTSTKISTNTVKEKIVKENLVGKESVPDKEGMKDSVLTTPNSYTVSVDEIFLKESIEKNKEKDFRCRALYETLLNRAESVEFAPIDNIGDVAKFKDKLFRYRHKYDTGEISCALELYAALPINSLHRRNITDYVKHEYQKWDFSKTRNENTVKGQFILEYILWHPVYAHFKVINEKGLLQADIENYSKRNTPPNKKEQPDDYWDVDPNHFE